MRLRRLAAPAYRRDLPSALADRATRSRRGRDKSAPAAPPCSGRHRGYGAHARPAVSAAATFPRRTLIRASACVSRKSQRLARCGFRFRLPESKLRAAPVVLLGEIVVAGVKTNPRGFIRDLTLLIKGVLRLGLFTRHPVCDDFVFDRRRAVARIRERVRNRERSLRLCLRERIGRARRRVSERSRGPGGIRRRGRAGDARRRLSARGVCWAAAISGAKIASESACLRCIVKRS